MAQQQLRGLWKLIDVTNSELSGHEFNKLLHFVDDCHYYSLSNGEVSRHRYRLRPEASPAEIDIGDSPGIYELKGDHLLMHRAMPGDPRPTTFENASVSVYKYVGEGPADWKVRYKQQIRRQLEEIASRFDEQAEQEAAGSWAEEEQQDEPRPAIPIDHSFLCTEAAYKGIRIQLHARGGARWLVGEANAEDVKAVAAAVRKELLRPANYAFTLCLDRWDRDLELTIIRGGQTSHMAEWRSKGWKSQPWATAMFLSGLDAAEDRGVLDIAQGTMFGTGVCDARPSFFIDLETRITSNACPLAVLVLWRDPRDLETAIQTSFVAIACAVFGGLGLMPQVAK